jgi:hypothetical protein
MQMLYLDNYRFVVHADNEDASLWEAVVSHVRGEYDWWYGEIADGIWCYVIATEYADGYVGNPDWSQLPVVFKSHIMAGLRGTLSA